MTIGKTIVLLLNWRYFDQSGAEAAHLVIFNRDAAVSWADKVFRREEEFNGQLNTVWEM